MTLFVDVMTHREVLPERSTQAGLPIYEQGHVGLRCARAKCSGAFKTETVFLAPFIKNY